MTLTVKPLVWDESKSKYPGPKTWSSGDPWSLWIVEIDGHFTWCEALDITFDGGPMPASPVRGVFPTLGAAKAAAQADYEARILSAIEAPSLTAAHAAGEREGIEKAAQCAETNNAFPIEGEAIAVAIRKLSEPAQP